MGIVGIIGLDYLRALRGYGGPVVHLRDAKGIILRSPQVGLRLRLMKPRL